MKQKTDIYIPQHIYLFGRYMNGSYLDSGRVVSPNGISPCVKENHGAVTAVLVQIDE